MTSERGEHPLSEPPAEQAFSIAWMQGGMRKFLHSCLALVAFPHELWHYIAGRMVGADPTLGADYVEIDQSLSTAQVIFVALLPAFVDLLCLILWLAFFPRAGPWLYVFWAGCLYWLSGLLGAWHDYRLVFAVYLNTKEKNNHGSHPGR